MFRSKRGNFSPPTRGSPFISYPSCTLPPRRLRLLLFNPAFALRSNLCAFCSFTESNFKSRGLSATQNFHTHLRSTTCEYGAPLCTTRRRQPCGKLLVNVGITLALGADASSLLSLLEPFFVLEALLFSVLLSENMGNSASLLFFCTSFFFSNCA